MLRISSVAIVLTLLSCAASVRPTPIARVMMIGNSITFRTPAMNELGWAGMWGVAATQASNDWVHQVWGGMCARHGYCPDMQIVSVTTATIPPEVAEQIRAYAPDVVIVQWGEVAAWDASPKWWNEQYQPLGEAAEDVGARAFAVGVWGNEEGDPRDERLQAAALGSSMAFVRISDIHTGQTEATADGACTHPAVCWHPGDKGMALIAERILVAIYSQATYLPLVRGGEGGTVPEQQKRPVFSTDLLNPESLAN